MASREELVKPALDGKGGPAAQDSRGFPAGYRWFVADLDEQCLTKLDNLKTGIMEAGVDPLVQLCWHDAAAAVRFLRVLAISGGMIAPAVALFCLALLGWSWTASAECERPLRWWLLVHATMQLAQAPVKLSLLVAVRTNESNLVDTTAAITTSPAWLMNRSVVIPTHFWFAMGIMWLAKSLGECPFALCFACATAVGEGVARILFVYFLAPQLFDLDKLLLEPGSKASPHQQGDAAGE